MNNIHPWISFIETKLVLHHQTSRQGCKATDNCLFRVISSRTSSLLQIACKLLMCVYYENVWLTTVEPEEEQGLRWEKVAFCIHTYIHGCLAEGGSRVRHHLSGTSAEKFSKHCSDVHTWPQPSTRRNVCISFFPPWMQSRTAQQQQQQQHVFFSHERLEKGDYAGEI